MLPSSSASPAGSSDAQSLATGVDAASTPSLANEQAPGGLSDPQERVFEVDAPRMAATVFPSWDAFFAYFAVYQRQTYQVYMSKSSTSWSTRNQRILSEPSSVSTASNDAAATTTGSDDASVAQEQAPAQLTKRKRASFRDAHDGATRRPPRVLPLVPEAVGVYAKTLTCTHGGKPRSRSQGIRQRQHFRSMQCPAKVNLVAKKLPGRDARDASAWQVVVTRHVVTHNHPLDAETYMQYPQNRRVNDPHVLETVDALSRAGVKQRQIRDYLAERAPHKRVTKSDVHNLLAKMKRKRRRTDEPTEASIETPLLSTMPTASTASSSVVATPPMPAIPAMSVMPTGLMPLPAAIGDVTQRRGWTQGGEGIDLQVTPLYRHNSGSTGNADAAVPGLSSALAATTQTDQEALTALTTAEVERSGSFRLRVDRLEEQNIAMYEENARLREVNATQRKQLQDAQALVVELREQIARLTGQPSNEEGEDVDPETGGDQPGNQQATEPRGDQEEHAADAPR